MSRRLAGAALLAALWGSPAACLPAQAAEGGEPLKIVTFGTSLTARGEWPAALGRALSRCLPGGASVEVVAQSGASSEWGIEAVERVVAARPDVVLAELYANDAAFDRVIGQEASRENMERIASRLVEGLPKARIYLLGMNPMFGRRGAVRPELEEYRMAHRGAGLREGLGYIDFGPRWKAIPPEVLTAAIPDGAHPRPAFATAVILPPLVAEFAGPCETAVPEMDLGPPASVERPVRWEGAP